MFGGLFQKQTAVLHIDEGLPHWLTMVLNLCSFILMHPWWLELGRLYVGGAGKSTYLKLVVMLVLLGEWAWSRDTCIVSASRSPPGLDMRTVCMRESFECRLHKPYMAPIFYVFFQNYNTFYAQIVNFGSSFGTTSALWCHFGRTLESFLNSEMHLAAKVAPGAPLGALPRNSLTFLEPFWRQFFNIFWQNESFG